MPVPSKEREKTDESTRKTCWLIWLTKPPHRHLSLRHNPRRRQRLWQVLFYKGPRVSVLSGVFL
jgi:hypothetical protein